MAFVRIGILGALEVRDASGRPLPVSGPRVRALLAVLALEAGRVIPAEVLISRLWDDPPTGAANALQAAVSRLRTGLQAAGLDGGLVEFRPPGYRLALPPAAVDALEFERLAGGGARSLRDGDPGVAARRLREALDLWHGPALADLAGTEFGSAQAARLEDLRRAATLDRIEADLALGGGSGLIAELRALADADPLAERPQALLMRALYAAGQQAQALAVYARARETLADQLGLDPSPELEQTHLAILRQQLPARQRSEPAVPSAGDAADREPPPGTGLPARLTSFVGREKETAQVAALLAASRLVTLTGPGGVGKTRLAIECAAGRDERIPGRVWLVELAPLSDPAEVSGAVLGALGLRGSKLLTAAGPGSGGRDVQPLGRLVAVIGNREALLVLDNCEHLVAAAAELAAALLAGCPQLRILATSREPLAITGEVVYAVPPLDSPPEQPVLTPADVLGYPAARLFADRAAAAAGFELDTANTAEVTRICRALDGIPLAIELAAARLRTLSPAQVADRLGDRFALLTAGDRTASARHKTLRAVMDWSWEMLSGQERLLARRLAVFHGGATLEAVQQVCAEPGDLPAGQIVDTMAGLVDKSLVTADQRAGGPGPRYQMLETVRQYCLERLVGSGEQPTVRRGHARYFLRLAETAEPELRRSDQLRWMRVLITENENLHAALRFAVDAADADLALRIAGALGYYWFLRGRYREQRPTAEAVLSLAWPGWQQTSTTVTQPPAVAAEHAWAIACCAITVVSDSWDVEPVRPLLVAAIEAGEAAPASVHPMMVLLRPLLAMLDGDFDTALHLLGPVAASADPWSAAMAQVVRAETACNMGRLDDAAADCETAEQAFRALGERWGMATATIQRGLVAGLRGDHRSEIATMEHGIRVLAEELSADEDLPDLLGQMALSRMATGNREGARAELERALGLAKQIGHDDAWLRALCGQLARMDRDLAAARRWYEAALGDLQKRSKPFQQYHAMAMAGLALVALAEGNVPEAASLLGTALQAAVESRAAPGIATVLEALAAFALGRQDRERAERAATLLGAAHGVRGGADPQHPEIAPVVTAARTVLGDDGFGRCYAHGRGLTLDEVLSFAGAGLPQRAQSAGPARPFS
jgi:predicted ATPase/DNA-binding SARP family transcriptional activator